MTFFVVFKKIQLILGGQTIFTFEYPVRSITGTPFRPVVVSSDGQYIVVSAADKTNRDCVIVHNAKTGALVHKIALKQSGIKVIFHLKFMSEHSSKTKLNFRISQH